MKFSCAKADLLRALQLANRAIGSQQALPILGNVLLEAQGKQCTVSATDLELSIITQFDASIESEGAVTVPAKAILNFAQYNPDADVLLETREGTQLRATSRHAKTMIAGEAASEYPTIASVERQTSFALEAEPLLHALHLVTFASAKTTLRPVLSGVSLRIEGGNFILVATDSYRLSEFIMPATGGSEGVSCIIPAKILDELRMILSSALRHPDDGGQKKADDGGTMRVPAVQVYLSKQQIEIGIGGIRLLSRLIDGKFPDYRQILPKESATEILLPTGEFSTAVKRMHYFAKEMNNNLTFHITKGQAKLSTPQTQAGKDEATLVAEVKGEENKIALSSSYLLDFLSHINTDNVLMKVTDSLHPAVFTLPDNPRFLHLIMPLRMQE